jgi:hypothetical protein
LKQGFSITKVPSFAVTLAPILAAALLTTLPGVASTVFLPVATSGAECIPASGMVVDNTINCSVGGGSAQVTRRPLSE